MVFKTGRYSGLLRPISYLIDLFIIFFLAKDFFQDNTNFLNFIVFTSLLRLYL